jgi:hypothetical protein
LYEIPKNQYGSVCRTVRWPTPLSKLKGFHEFQLHSRGPGNRVNGAKMQ